MKKSLIVMAALCMVMTSLASADWTAYNDCVLGTNNGVNGGDSNAANTTLIVANGNQTGSLKDFSTGLTIPTVQAQVVNSGMVYGGSGGMANFTAGTDAATLFNGKVDMDGAVVYYGPSGWYCDVTLTGLDSTKLYTFAASLDRGTGSPAPGTGYTNRWSVVSILDVDSSTYACSVAPVGNTTGLLKLSETAVSIQSMNTVNGYIAQWTNIQPGADGDFTVHFTYARAGEWGSTGQDGVKGYGPGGFMVAETIPEPATMSLLVLGGLAMLRRRTK